MWPFNKGDCLIQVVCNTGLTVLWIGKENTLSRAMDIHKFKSRNVMSVSEVSTLFS